MKTLSLTRDSARAALRLAAFGSSVALGLGMAYAAGALFEHATAQHRAERLAAAAAGGFSEAALEAHNEEMNDGALAIAQRFDPGTSRADRDRATLFAASLERIPVASVATPTATRAFAEALRPVLTTFSPAAQPFRMAGALDGARDLDCLTQAVYSEARGESLAGQAAVAQVVLNRVRHPAFPKTVCGVVYQGAQAHACQFSFACDGSMNRQRQGVAWARAKAVAAKALAGYVAAEVGNATHFHAARISPQWGGMIRVAQVGQHIFYRFSGRSGAPGSFHESPQPSITEAPRAVYASLTPLPEAPAKLQPAVETIKPAQAVAPVAKSAIPAPAVKATEKPAETAAAAPLQTAS